MFYGLYALIILTSIVFIPANVFDATRVPKEALFSSISLVTISLPLFFDRVRDIRFCNKWVASTLIFISLSFLYVFFKPIIFDEFNGMPVWNVWTIRPTINLVLGVILIITLVENTNDLKHWLILSKILCALAGVYSVYMIFQWFGIDQFHRNFEKIFDNNIFNRRELMIGFLDNPFLSSNYIAVISPLCLMFKELRYKLIYLSIFIALIMAQSAISIGAFFIGLITYLILTGQKKKVLLSIVVMLGIGFIAFVIEPTLLSFSGRLDAWKDVIDKTTMTFTGHGLGSFPMKFRFGDKFAQQAHNEFIQIFHEGGFILLILAFGYVATLLKKVWYLNVNINSMLLIGFTCSFLAYLVICLGGFPLRIAPLAALGIINISVLETFIHGGVYVK